MPSSDDAVTVTLVFACGSRWGLAWRRPRVCFRARAYGASSCMRGCPKTSASESRGTSPEMTLHPGSEQYEADAPALDFLVVAISSR